MRYLVSSLAIFLVASPAFAQTAPNGAPSPEMDLGLAAIVMLAGAAFLARLRR
jgi:hypothetical protein